MAISLLPCSKKYLAAKLPTFPNPSMATLAFFMSMFLCSAAILDAIKTPKPVLPNSLGRPFNFLGFPVADLLSPLALTYHPISSSPMFISGAAMYLAGEISFNDLEKASTISFLLCFDICLSSAIIPALAPPKGRSASAHFHVIVLANLKTSSSETVGVILIPPFPGPSAELSTTKKPLIVNHIAASQLKQIPHLTLIKTDNNSFINDNHQISTLPAIFLHFSCHTPISVYIIPYVLSIVFIKKLPGYFLKPACRSRANLNPHNWKIHFTTYISIGNINKLKKSQVPNGCSSQRHKKNSEVQIEKNSFSF